jgi:predicted DNA-binding transcriptional regulator AlpA
MLIENIGTTGAATTADQPMTESEAAFRLGLKVATLRAWRHQGRGPAYVRLGRAVRYLVIDIDEFLNSNRHNPRQTATHERSTRLSEGGQS